MKLKSVLTAVLLTSLFFSCQKDNTSETDKYLDTFTAKVRNEVTGSVTGYVYDENNKPIADAEVAIYSGRTRSDKHGFFVFENQKMDSKGTFIKVFKKGYLHGSDMIYPAAGTTSYARVKLLSSNAIAEFDSGAGGKIGIPGGGYVSFEPSSIVDDKGNLYTGNVSVTLKYLNPNDDDLGDAMPGALEGRRDGGGDVVLGTLGMIAAELHDSDGNLLNIGKGKTATIEIPAKTQNRPATIPLWWFDESEGVWVEEGSASLQGSFYIGQVSHFSFWNCDQPYFTAYACLKFIYEDGTPAQALTVNASVDQFNVRYSQTNSKGEICSYFPKDKVVGLVAFQLSCLKEFMVGPFSEGKNDDVTLVMPGKKVTILHVKCGNLAVSKGIIKLRTKDKMYYTTTKEDGSIDLQTTFNICGVKEPIYVSAFDNKTGNTSVEKELDVYEYSTTTLDVCEVNCGFSAVLDISKISDSPLKYAANCLVNGGSGNFGYQWSNGVTASSLQVSESFERICVTVEDKVEGCSKTYCKSQYLSGCENLQVLCDVTSTGWCGTTKQFEILFKNTGNNTYDLIRTDNNESDFSLGAYELCYGPSAVYPGGDLRLLITDCQKVQYTGKSRWGETYYIRGINSDGDQLYLSWKNDYDPEAGEAILKRQDGLKWPKLYK